MRRQMQNRDFFGISEKSSGELAKEYWDEFRICKSCTNAWERVMMASIFRRDTAWDDCDKEIDRQMRGRTSPDVDPVLSMAPSGSSYWTITIDPPWWFIDFHLE